MGQERVVSSLLPVLWPQPPLAAGFLDPIWSFCHHHSHDPVLDRKSPALVSKEKIARETASGTHLPLRRYHPRALV